MGGRDPKYGADHDKQRRIWDRRVQAGVVRCARCRNPILPGSPWHLDHAEDGRTYRGPAHKWCNLSAAGKKRAAQLFGASLVNRECWCGDPAPDPRCPRSAADCLAGRACQHA